MCQVRLHANRLRFKSPKTRREYELFVTGKGEEILKSYTDVCEQVSRIDRETAEDGSIMSLIDCYNEIFKESTPHYQCAEAFMRATSLLGYSIEIDKK